MNNMNFFLPAEDSDVDEASPLMDKASSNETINRIEKEFEVHFKQKLNSLSLT
jgi:hypothetical protein